MENDGAKGGLYVLGEINLIFMVYLIKLNYNDNNDNNNKIFHDEYILKSCEMKNRIRKIIT